MHIIQEKISLLVGGEVFCDQSAGGISRIFRETLPLLRDCPEISEVRMHMPNASLLRQSVDELSDRQTNYFVGQNCRPYRLRRKINTIMQQVSDWRFQHSREKVYLPTYYTCPPKGMPSVCFVYDMIHERFSERFPAKERDRICNRKRAALQSAARILCISRQTKADVVEYYGVDPAICSLCYLGGGEPKTKEQSSAVSLSGSCLHILYVGNANDYYKNFRFLLKACDTFAAEKNQHVQVHLVSRWKLFADARELEGSFPRVRILLHANADDRELGSLYQSCHAFAYPSLWEGFGIPVVEALSWGCPVICSDIPVFHEVGGDVVGFFNPKDSDAFCSALEGALHEGRTGSVVQQRKDAAAVFTWKQCANAMLHNIIEASGF